MGITTMRWADHSNEAGLMEVDGGGQFVYNADGLLASRPRSPITWLLDVDTPSPPAIVNRCKSVATSLEQHIATLLDDPAITSSPQSAHLFLLPNTTPLRDSPTKAFNSVLISATETVMAAENPICVLLGFQAAWEIEPKQTSVDHSPTHDVYAFLISTQQLAGFRQALLSILGAWDIEINFLGQGMHFGLVLEHMALKLRAFEMYQSRFPIFECKNWLDTERNINKVDTNYPCFIMAAKQISKVNHFSLPLRTATRLKDAQFVRSPPMLGDAGHPWVIVRDPQAGVTPHYTRDTDALTLRLTSPFQRDQEQLLTQSGQEARTFFGGNIARTLLGDMQIDDNKVLSKETCRQASMQHHLEAMYVLFQQDVPANTIFVFSELDMKPLLGVTRHHLFETLYRWKHLACTLPTGYPTSAFQILFLNYNAKRQFRSNHSADGRPHGQCTVWAIKGADIPNVLSKYKQRQLQGPEDRSFTQWLLEEESKSICYSALPLFETEPSDTAIWPAIIPGYLSLKAGIDVFMYANSEFGTGPGSDSALQFWALEATRCPVNTGKPESSDF